MASVARTGAGAMTAVLARGQRSQSLAWALAGAILQGVAQRARRPLTPPPACQEPCQMGRLWRLASCPACRPPDLSSWDLLACPSEVTLPLSPQKPRPLTLIKNKQNLERNPAQTSLEMIVSPPSPQHTRTPTHTHSLGRAGLQPGFHINKLLQSVFCLSNI